MSKARAYSEEYVLINGIYQYFLHYPSPQKEVIIYLHGGPGESSANYAHVFSSHYDFCNVVFYDQRGAGRTQKKNKSKPEDLTLETLIHDLNQTINYVKEKYKTDRVVLLAQSWGTVLGTQYALRYPEDIICYIGNGHCVNARRELKITFDKLREAIEAKGNKRDLKKLVEMQNLPNMDVEDKNYFETAKRFFFLRTKYGLTIKLSNLLKIILSSPIFKISDLFLIINGSKTNFNLVKWLTGYSIWDVTEYAVPVFYILGRDDWQTPSTLAAEYFKKINAPSKGLFWVENAGHMTDMDNPAGFHTAVREIITQQ